MTQECLRLVEHLGEPLDPALSEHVARCQDCQAVLQAHQSLSRVPALPPSGDSAPPPRLLAASRPARRWWIEGAALAFLNVAMVAAGIGALSAHARVGNLAPPAILWALGVVLALVTIAGPIIAVAPGGRALRTGLLPLLPLLAVAVALGGSGLQPESWLQAGIGCLLVEISLSIVPAIAVVWALTHSAFRLSRAAIAGFAAGAVGALALHVHCPFGSVSHLLFFHVLPWMALIAASVAVRNRLSSTSFAP